MAKIVKKKPAAKAAIKTSSKASGKAVKAISKPIKKTAAKPEKLAPVKKAEAKAVIKKKADLGASKLNKKPELKKKPEVKALKAPVHKAGKEQKAPQTSTKEIQVKKTPEKIIPVKPVAPALAEKQVPKKDLKPVKKVKAKGKEKEKDDSSLEDVFIADEDMMGDEIGEYEEELKAVEEADEEAEVIEEWAAEEKIKTDEEIILTDAEGRRYCRARDCDQIAAVDAYCRFHYLMFWKKIQIRKKILMDGKLERYVEELTARYPDKFLEMIRRDLRTEKDFLAAIQELEIDESANENDFEEDSSAFIEEVRGVGESSGSVDDDDY